jgi:hypothetical protein
MNKQNRNKKYPKVAGEKKLTRPRCKYCGNLGALGEKSQTITTKLGTHYRVPVSHTACVASLSLSSTRMI